LVEKLLNFNKDERPDFKQLEKILIYDLNAPKEYIIDTDVN
jgi:hypothetical protein